MQTLYVSTDRAVENYNLCALLGKTGSRVKGIDLTKERTIKERHSVVSTVVPTLAAATCVYKSRLCRAALPFVTVSERCYTISAPAWPKPSAHDKPHDKESLSKQLLDVKDS
ncbi:hypothetical protein O6H91_01G048600 [Diphasiastrum complanatum]|uniref:Uncharacterized protein n=1 Tax=Diphasiastrum complanatum TaxID=34168 RepID=A0ACC2EQW7_DIPCM|nr:hypothetical protein O6H91_01G048600 [Diphasiastrum complanatum]